MQPIRATLKSLNKTMGEPVKVEKEPEKEQHRRYIGDRCYDVDPTNGRFTEVEDNCTCDSCTETRARKEAEKLKWERIADEEEAYLIQEQKNNPERWLKASGVPRKYLPASFLEFEGGESVKELCKHSVKERESMMLCGKTGCGKTHLAVAMLRHLITSTYLVLWPPNGIYGNGDGQRAGGPKVLFASVPEILLEIRESYKKDSTTTESEVIDKYADVSLLVLDDLGAEKTTEWVESTLYLIIDRRNRWERWTIVTSNLTLPEIETSLGARIASRLADMKVVNIKLPDHRKRR